jgi:hypothetical protein
MHAVTQVTEKRVHQNYAATTKMTTPIEFAAIYIQKRCLKVLKSMRGHLAVHLNNLSQSLRHAVDPFIDEIM